MKGGEGTVAILMGCYNGAKHLQEQLDSIRAQTCANWILIASDDGSSDDTRELLACFRRRMGDHRVVLRDGPRRGFLANFLQLGCHPGVPADCFAFCDQDDVWEPTKLERALAVLRTVQHDVPALYCSRTRLIDESGRDLGASTLFARPPSFRNALVQSIAGANTMVFNRAAQTLLHAAGPHASVASHDWWLYLLVSGAGGIVIYDPEPLTRYRQHPRNLVGRNNGFKAAMSRMGGLLKGRYAAWNAMHCAALASIESLLTAENRELLAVFRRAREQRLFRRVSDVARARLFRQTWLGNLGLYASVVMKKF